MRGTLPELPTAVHAGAASRAPAARSLSHQPTQVPSGGSRCQRRVLWCYGGRGRQKSAESICFCSCSLPDAPGLVLVLVRMLVLLHLRLSQLLWLLVLGLVFVGAASHARALLLLRTGWVG